MLGHSERELVSRDRGGDSALAARQGAPQAIQTADRFHVCKHVTDAVEKALARCRAERRTSQKAENKSDEETSREKPTPALLTANGKRSSAHQTERSDRSQQVMALREQGAPVKDIAQRVGLGRRTIQRWLSEGAYVETHDHHRHRSRFDSSEASVRKRWDEGVPTIQQIWRESKAQGYPHADRALRRHVDAGKSLPRWKRLAFWIIVPRRKRSGSSFAPVMICRRQSEKNSWLYAWPALRQKPSLNVCRSFFVWFAPAKEHHSTPR